MDLPDGLARSHRAVADAKAGERRVGLNTDSRSGALDLYCGLGLIIEHTFVHRSKLLCAAP